ncbi:MAG: DUF4861 domain-containing protein [Bacteroidales bacterium]
MLICIRNNMKKLVVMCLAALAFACTQKEVIIVSVWNLSEWKREGELAEITLDTVRNLLGGEPFVVFDPQGRQAVYQITYDGKVIFPATVDGLGKTEYRIQRGTPVACDTIVYGKLYSERLDDIAWENDRIAFRTYGPALQASGERAFGYDIWVKNVPDLVVEDRYYQEAVNGISYHIDHGNGLDYYNVGATLGAGTAALMAGNMIVYPYCYRMYEILDNGPLRFTVKLTYHPLAVGGDTNVVETRLLSLDAGSQLNKVTLTYAGLSKETPLATGIVIHEPAWDYQADAEKGYMAYADPADQENGQLYAGVVFTEKVNEIKPAYFTAGEKADRKAGGHILAIGNYTPGTRFTYYWGGGWSKWGFPTPEDWYRYVGEFAQKVKEPLKITIK